MPSTANPSNGASLARQVGLLGAVLLGLGSMVGTGLFVSTAMVVQTAGDAALFTVALAALVALCNGLNSAQLAAAHPVAGGTYEYGYRLLTPSLGFSAGWLFLCAKGASAATAALALATYGPQLLQLDLPPGPVAVGLVVAVTALVSLGIRSTNGINGVLIAVSLVCIGVFVVACLQVEPPQGPITPRAGPSTDEFFLGAALMFVAFTGYGRVATLGEEIVHPERNIPIAVLLTVAMAAAVYATVTWAITAPLQGLVDTAAANPSGSGPSGSGASGSGSAAYSAAPLHDLAEATLPPTAQTAIAIGAFTAMLSVLLNLILGLSRMAVAMGRRRDLPPRLARLTAQGNNPRVAVLSVGAAIALITLVGDVRTTWTFSAVTVLLYYSITNLSALRLPDSDRRFPRALAIVGLGACLFLAVWVPWPMWAAAGALLAGGFALRAAVRGLTARGAG